MNSKEDNGILQEITPLGEHDFMFVADRHKTGYDRYTSMIFLN